MSNVRVRFSLTRRTCVSSLVAVGVPTTDIAGSPSRHLLRSGGGSTLIERVPRVASYSESLAVLYYNYFELLLFIVHHNYLLFIHVYFTIVNIKYSFSSFRASLPIKCVFIIITIKDIFIVINIIKCISVTIFIYIYIY